MVLARQIFHLPAGSAVVVGGWGGGCGDRATITLAGVSLGVAGKGGASSRRKERSSAGGAGVSSTGPFSTLASLPVTCPDLHLLVPILASLC